MKGKERKLSPAELKRKEAYERLCQEMEQAGYRKRELTVGVLAANTLSLLLSLPFAIAITVIYFLVNPQGSFQLSSLWWLVFFPVFFLLTAVHEFIHGLTWSRFCSKGFGSIAFGVIWKALTPYCSCSEPLTKGQYILGGAMPTLVLGLALSVSAVALARPFLLVLAVTMVLAGGGDMLIIAKLLCYRPKCRDTLYYDHPYECGLTAFER